MKKCNKCKKNKDLTAFSKNSLNKDGLNRECRACHNKYRRDRFRTDSEYRQRKRNQERFSRHRITPEAYNALLEKQDGKCAICGFTEKVKKRALAVDHNHKTGKIRGLLCGNCNTGLGLFKDSISRLQRGIQYLNNFKETI